MRARGVRVLRSRRPRRVRDRFDVARTGSRSSSSTSSEATRSSSSATGRTTGRTSATPVELRPPPIASATSPPAARPGSRASSGAPPTSPGSAPAASAARGSVRRLAVRSGPLRATVEVALWGPDGVRDGVPLPLLVVHDGPEYERQTGLTARAAELIRTERVPPHRIALLDPGPRDEWYSASALLRPRAHRRGPARARPRRRGRGPARRHGREPRRARDAARPAPRAGRVLRALPAVRVVLHAPLRPHGVGLLALRADRPLRARRPARPGLRRAGPGDADVRGRGGQRPQQPPRHGGAEAPGLRRIARRDAGQPRLRAPGAPRSTRTSTTCSRPRGWSADGAPPRRAVLARRSAPTASSSPTATSAGRCSRSRPSAAARGSTRTAAWSARSPG